MYRWSIVRVDLLSKGLFPGSISKTNTKKAAANGEVYIIAGLWNKPHMTIDLATHCPISCKIHPDTKNINWGHDDLLNDHDGPREQDGSYNK